MGRGWGRVGEKVQRIRSINGRHKIEQGEVKNSMGNGETKEPICMTHGHELMWGNAGGIGCTGLRRIKGRKTMG